MNKKNRNITLFVLGLAIFVVVLDGTFMNIAMNAIVHDLNTSLESVQTMITVYSAVMAAFTLIGARLGDKIGRKKIFLIGTTLFGIGALIAAFATNSYALLIGWSIIEGLGASLMMPATLAILASDFKGKDRALGLGIWGAVSAMGAAFGPIIGGYLTTSFTWRLAFGLEIIPIILVLTLSIFIPDPKNYLTKKKLDIKGSIVSAFSLSLIIYALLHANNYGWVKPQGTSTLLGFSLTIWFLLIATVLFIYFIKIEQKCMQSKNCAPLIELDIFKNKTFVLSLIIALIITIAQAGALLVLPIFLLTFRHFPALNVSITLLPLMLAVLVTSTLGSKFYKHKKKVTILGLLVTTLSAFILKNQITEVATLNSITLGLIILGLGIGLIMSQLTNITISSVSIKRAGEASGLNSTIRRFGAALGTAIMGTIMFSLLTTNFAQEIKQYTTIPNRTQKQLTISIKTKQTLNITSLNTLQKEQKSNINKIYTKTFIYSTRKTMDVMIFILIPAIIAAILLPNDKQLNIDPD